MFDVQKHSGHVEGLSHYRLTKAYPAGIFWSVSLFTAQSLEALTKGRWTPFVWWEVAMMHAIISPPGQLKSSSEPSSVSFPPQQYLRQTFRPPVSVHLWTFLLGRHSSSAL